MNLIHWLQPNGQIAEDIAKFMITKSSDRTGSFILLETIDAKSGSDWVLQSWDSTGTKADWYIIEYQNTDSKTISKSIPMKGEPTSASSFDMLYELREAIGDMSEPFCFPDNVLLHKLNEALTLHNRNLDWNTIPEPERVLVIWLAVADICLVLAQDSGKFYPLSIGGVTIDKSQRVAGYTSLHDKYKERYDEKKEQWKLEAEGSGYIKESYMTRESRTTGRRTPYIHALPPEAIKIYQGSMITAGSVDLRWDKSTDPGYYYYVIYRSTIPNVQKAFVEDIYHKRIALYEDPGDSANAVWGNITFPVRMIFRNSVNYWQDQNRENPNTFYAGPAPKLYAGQTYYYCVGVVNKNILLTLSNELMVKLPAFGPPIIYPVLSIEGIVRGQSIPTADVEIHIKKPTDDDFTVETTLSVPPGTLPTFAHGYGAGTLPVGTLIKSRHQFNNEWSDLSTEIVVT